MLDTIKRAFVEFLAIPTLIIIGFILLAAGTYTLDRAAVTWLDPVRVVLRTRVFTDAGATADLLGTIAGSIITVTSITISLLLIAVQQAASAMTSQVFDQFLRRRHNQFHFGFFVGLALFTLLTLATVDDPFNPVFGASLVLLFTVVALYLLIILLYTTINQMRPVEVIETIHDLTLAARKHQLSLVRRTRRKSRHNAVGATVSVKSNRHGYVTKIDVDALDLLTKDSGGKTEVVFHISIGSYVAFNDVFAEVTAGTIEEANKLCEEMRHTVRLERQRDIDVDPAYGIEQLATIGWTSISTSKSDPAPGLLTIRSLRDVLARWCVETKAEEEERILPVVYADNTFDELMNAFESLAIVSSESMQHQNFTEVVHTLAVMLDRLPANRQQRVEDLILCIISALGDHVLTADLNAALSELSDALDAAGKLDTAQSVLIAQAELAKSVGKLNSRSTRVPNTP